MVVFTSASRKPGISPMNLSWEIVTYQGMQYATLDSTNPDDTSSGCQTQGMLMRPGWSLATEGPGAVYVAASDGWGTERLTGQNIFLNTKNYMYPGSYSRMSYFSKDDNGYYTVHACPCRILIQKPLPMPTFAPSQEPTPFPSFAPSAQPTESPRSMNRVDTPGADSGVICPDLTWELVNGKDLYSSSKEFLLDFMFDGSMILYQQSGNNWKSLWSSKNNSKWSGDFSFEADGDVLVYKNGPWLAVNQVANPDTFIALGNDGNLAQYSRSDLSPLWSSNTATKGIAPNLDIKFLNTKCPTKAPSPAPTRKPTPGPTSEEQHELYELTIRLKAIEEKAAKTDRVSTWFFDAKNPPVQEYQG
jgi:hypothetical protein